MHRGQWLDRHPQQSLRVETLSADTFNCVWDFPAPRYRNFVHFARSYGFCSVNDRDKYNKNIFHYFFGAVVYCWLAADIAKTAFSAGEERLPGNYTLAMSQQVVNGTPSGFTPLHVLTTQKGVNTVAAKIIADLIDSDIVPLDAFSEQKNDKVSVL